MYSRDAYDLLLSRLDTLVVVGIGQQGEQGLPHTVPIDPKLQPKKTDYSKVVYWEKELWTLRERSLAHNVLKGKKDTTHVGFLEDENGAPITNGELKALRKTIRTAWNAIALAKQTPSTWSLMPPHALEYFRNTVYKTHRYLMLCNRDWKLDSIATLDYPSWIGHRKALIYITGPVSNVKTEEIDAAIIVQEVTASCSLKRASTEDRCTTKKAKIESNTILQLSGDETMPLGLSDSQFITNGVFILFIKLCMLIGLRSH